MIYLRCLLEASDASESLELFDSFDSSSSDLLLLAFCEATDVLV